MMISFGCPHLFHRDHSIYHSEDILIHIRYALVSPAKNAGLDQLAHSLLGDRWLGRSTSTFLKDKVVDGEEVVEPDPSSMIILLKPKNGVLFNKLKLGVRSYNLNRETRLYLFRVFVAETAKIFTCFGLHCKAIVEGTVNILRVRGGR